MSAAVAGPPPYRRGSLINVSVFTLPAAHLQGEPKDALPLSETCGQRWPVDLGNVAAAPALAKNVAPFGEVRKSNLFWSAGWGRIASRLLRETGGSPDGMSYVSLQRSRWMLPLLGQPRAFENSESSPGMLRSPIRSKSCRASYCFFTPHSHFIRIFVHARSSESHHAPPLGMLQLPFGLMLRAKPPRLLLPQAKAEAAPLLASSMLAPVLVHDRFLECARPGFITHFDYLYIPADICS